jgi:hypothetical protein
MLIPFTPLVASVQEFRKQNKIEYAAISEQSTEGVELITAVARRFQTSRDASRVRLLQRKMLVSGNWESLLQ